MREKTSFLSSSQVENRGKNINKWENKHFCHRDGMARLEEQSGSINTIFCQGELHVTGWLAKIFDYSVVM